VFNFDQPETTRDSGRTPLNVITIGAAKDEQTAKQLVKQDKEYGIFTVFHSYLSIFLLYTVYC
jgi:hypothetical protein